MSKYSERVGAAVQGDDERCTRGDLEVGPMLVRPLNVKPDVQPDGWTRVDIVVLSGWVVVGGQIRRVEAQRGPSDADGEGASRSR